MDITEIKQRLTLLEVLNHYGLKADKNTRLSCPFHEDKTPSMQVYHKTHTAYCFSSNCPTHGKSLDVIDFIQHKESSTKAQAIQKAKELLGPSLPHTTVRPLPSPPAPQQLVRTAVLTRMFTYFKNAVCNSKPALDYLKCRGIDPIKIEVGYNTAQFHHGTRKEAALISSCVEVGLLLPWGSKKGEPLYKPFAKYSLAFPLKNKEGQLTGLYFRSIVNEDNARHYYLKDSTGLYPGYPTAATQRLILTEAIIDAATLLQIPEIEKNYTLLAAYGTNRLTAEHKQAIQALKNLKEIIFAFDNDEAGNKAVEKYSNELRADKLILSRLNLPEGEDINSVSIAHEPEIFIHLLEKRTLLEELSFSIETPEPSKPQAKAAPQDTHHLDTRYPFKISYKTATAHYYIQGGVSKTLDSMKVTLVVEHPGSQQKARNKIDLYEDKPVEKLCKEVSEKLSLRKDLLEGDIYKLTDLLDHYRESQLPAGDQDPQAAPKDIIIPLTAQERQQIEAFARKPNLITRLNDILGKAGIVGEEKNRIFLLVIAASYKMPETLHALIQGSSGSGKTRLLKQISDCIPQEKVTKLTRISDKVLYNYPEHYFVNRLFCLEDMDGLSEEAEFAFRELQSNGELSSAVSIKQENGTITQGEKRVKGPIASMACTTQGEIYEDNMGRCFLVAVDESPEQTARVIGYQDQRASGIILEEEQHKVKHFLQNFIRELKPLKVVNPYAGKIQLPPEAHKIRRLNELFQSFVKMVTLFNQYQRKKDDKGRLITQIEDLETSVIIMFESIVLKVDELDGSLRQFYEKLKAYIEKKSRKHEFTRFEIREATGLGKTQQHHYINQLLSLEYLQQHGFANRGFHYRIAHWDNYTALRDRIRKSLQQQLDMLRSEHHPNANRTPGEAKNTEITL